MSTRKLAGFLIAVLATISVLVVGLAGNERSLHEAVPAPGLTRSPDVVAAKIAGKQTRLAGGGERAQHPDGYLEYRRLMRPHPEGTNVTQLLLDAKQHVKGMTPVAAAKDAGLWNWDWLGPGNIGGRVRAILLHSDDPATMWAGSAGGGVWKTTNGGIGWYPLTDLLPSLAITSLVMDPNDPDIIYAGTGEGFGNVDALPGAGIFKSYDGGVSWTQLQNTIDPDMYYVNDLAQHPAAPGVLLACTADTNLAGHIWASTDAGANWSIVLDTPGRATDVKYDPDNPNVVIAGTSVGAWRSEFGGAAGTWSEISVGGAQLPDTTGRCEIAFHDGSDVVYASCAVPRGANQPTGEIWRSMDNGVTWEQRSSNIYYLGNQGWYDNVIWVEPQFANSIMVGGINLWKSIDGGATLTVMSNWQVYHLGVSAHSDQHAVVPHINYDADTNLTIFFGNDGGVQSTTLGFLTSPTSGWVNLANNLGITQFYHADTTPDGSLILGGAQDNDDLRFTRSSGAQNWFQAETGDGTFCAIDPDNPDIMDGCYPWLGMERSTNGGDSYFDISGDIADAGDRSTAMFVSPFALDKEEPSQLLAGGRSIWFSTNRGGNWSSVLGPRPGSPLCTAVEISPGVGAQVAWVGYNDGQIWKTENGATSWFEVDDTGAYLPDGEPVTDIEISPRNANVVLVSFGGYLTDRVHLTADNGQTWTTINGGGNDSLPPVQVNCVSFHPLADDWIYAGTDIGLFASDDLGQHWNVTSRYGWNEGPVFTEISDLIWHSYSTLIAVTHGRGMYECLPLPVVWVDQANNGEEDGTHLNPWSTFGEGYNAIGNGAEMILLGGDYDEGGRWLEKRIEIKGSGGTVTIH